VWISIFSHACCIARLSHPSWFDHPNAIRRGVHENPHYAVSSSLILRPPTSAQIHVFSSAPCSRSLWVCWIWDSHGGDSEDYSLLKLTACSLLDSYQRFGGTCCLYLQGRLFRFLWNDGNDLRNYMSSELRRQ
jgi:hypothetical protein